MHVQAMHVLYWNKPVAYWTVVSFSVSSRILHCDLSPRAHLQVGYLQMWFISGRNWLVSGIRGLVYSVRSEGSFQVNSYV